jgi:microcystin-dependent protein
MAAQDTSLGNPVGTIIALAVNRGGEFGGYLLCNGQDIPAGAKYNALRTLLGSTYGAGKVPNFQGMFLRGQGSRTLASGKDGANTTHASGSLGSWQGDAIREISGSATNTLAYGNFERGSGALHHTGRNEFGADNGDGSGFGAGTLSFAASRVVPTANENRPANYAVYYYIKY